MVKGNSVFFFARVPPVSLAAVCAALLVYTQAVPYRDRDPFATVLPAAVIDGMTGTVLSAPVKTSGGDWYMMRFAPETVYAAPGKESRLQSASAAGTVRLFVPAETVEALYPGKLYSAASTTGTQPIDAGAILDLSGYLTFFSDAGSSIPVFFTDSGADAAIVRGWSGRGNGKFAALRADMRLRFRRLMYTWGDAGGLVLALLSGSREYTEPVLAESFMNAGLAHVLALSGMHLSLFGGMAVTAGTVLVGRYRARYVSSVFILFFIWFAGLSPSLLRALLCSIAAGLCSRCGFAPNRFSVLSLAFIVHCCLFPADVHELSFMLSYGALAGMLTTGKAIEKKLSRILLRVPAGKSVAADLAASVGAQFLTAPVCLRSFGLFIPGGIPASAVVSPLANWFMIAAVVCLAVSLVFPPFSVAAGFLMNLLYLCVKYPAMMFAQIPVITCD